MRVALIASSLRLAGAEKQFVYIARALHESGVEIDVFYLGNGDHYRTVLMESGIPVRQIYKQGRPLHMLMRLIRELRRFKPDVVLASQFADLRFAAPAGRLCRALVLGGVRSDGFHEFRTTGWPSSLLVSLSHGLIANSRRAKQNLISKGINGAKIAVLPNVIDLVDFDHRAAMPSSRGLPLDRSRITAVGTLQPCKRFERFLQTLALARLSEPTVYGVLAGKDLGVRPQLEQTAKELGLLPGHMEFVGECHDIPALLNQSGLLVLCSDYEGFPNVILEAMAARLPVVTTPAGDAGLLVQQDVTGYVIEKDHIPRMADCLVTLVQNKKLAAQMGEAGRKRVEESYAFPVLGNRLFRIFSQFASSQRRSGVLKMLEQCRSSDGPSRSISAPSCPVG
jgi:glycosyltransferase involved in cell wall biosynthesis